MIGGQAIGMVQLTGAGPSNIPIQAVNGASLVLAPGWSGLSLTAASLSILLLPLLIRVLE